MVENWPMTSIQRALIVVLAVFCVTALIATIVDGIAMVGGIEKIHRSDFVSTPVHSIALVMLMYVGYSVALRKAPPDARLRFSRLIFLALGIVTLHGVMVIVLNDVYVDSLLKKASGEI